MQFFLLTTVLIACAAAGPVADPESALHELAKAFPNHAFPLPRELLSGFNIFRRQGDCPILTSVCPSGICCSYDGPCCGSTCCDSSSVCAGTDSSGEPCCVAISASSNTCGGSNSNPCADYPGTVPCSNINVCCPPSNICYYDSNNLPRCAPQGSSNSQSSSSYIPVTPISSLSTTTPIPVAPVTTHTTSSASISPTPTPDFSDTDSSSSSGSSVTNDGKSNFWSAAVIGGIAGGGAVFLVLVGLIIYCCIGKPWGRGTTGGLSKKNGNTGSRHTDKPEHQTGAGSKQLLFTGKSRDPLSNLSEPDLPKDKGDNDSANLASDFLKGTNIYDPVMIEPTESLSKEERERRWEKQNAVNEANQPLYLNKDLTLVKGEGKIRILILKPSKKNTAAIRCKMTAIELNTSKYEALSYTWGDPLSRSQVKINNFGFSVTKDLESTLRHLRHSTEERRIWIDAICINQGNKSEIEWHIDCMRDVYMKATRTLIWLGNGTLASDTAIDFFNKRGRCHASIPALLEDFESNKESWRCLQDILERPWWSRLWIVQEVIVSRTALLLCGNHSIEFSAIPKMLGIAMRYNLDIFSYSNFISQYRRNINLLQHYRLQWHKGDSLSFEWWVRVFGFKQGCLKPKDKINALRALAGDHENGVLSSLKYTDSASDWYTGITTYIISTSQREIGKDIDFICLGRGARRNQNFDPEEEGPVLPSWIPDLTLAPWESYPTLTRKSWLSSMPRQMWRKEDDFQASRPIGRFSPDFGPGGAFQGVEYMGTAKVSFLKGGRVLKVEGFIVDRVEDLGQEYDLKLTPENFKQGTLTRSQIEHHHEVLKEIRGLVSKAKQLHSEQYPRGNCTYDWAVSKTLVCDRNAQNQRLAPEEPGFRNSEFGGVGAMAEPPQGRFDEHSMDQHFQRVHRRFMVATKGCIGLVPPETQQGDSVCILFGCSVPVILRARRVFNSRGELEAIPSMEFIGECYIHGVMDGEVVRDWSRGTARVVDIEIE